MSLLNSIQEMTADNGAIKSLRELIVKTAFKDENFEQLVTGVFNKHNGEKLGFIGDLDEIGRPGSGCDPEYYTPGQEFVEKTWAIGDFEAPLEWCVEDFKQTIAEYCIKHDTNEGDLTTSEIMDIVILPALDNALKRLYWRLGWFGDTGAKNVTGGGVITDGKDTSLFTACDGLWKRIFAIAAANAEQRVTIAANTQNTKAAQKSGIRTAGVAIKIVDDMLAAADARIEQNGGVLMLTKSLADALAADIKKEYKEIMPWEDVFEGVKKSSYNGIPVYSIGIWDRYISAYESNGTKLNLPHRGVFAAPSNLLVGTPDDKLMQDFDIFFDRKARTTNAYLHGAIGTLVGEDDLVVVAY